jgi:hypothetical protein
MIIYSIKINLGLLKRHLNHQIGIKFVILEYRKK